MIREAGEIILKFRGLTAALRQRITIIVGDDEALQPQGVGLNPIVHDPHRGPRRAARGQLPGRAARGRRADIELHDLIGHLVGGDGGGVESIVSHLVAARPVIDHGRGNPRVRVVDVIGPMHGFHRSQRRHRSDAGGDSYRLGGARHRRAVE